MAKWQIDAMLDTALDYISTNAIEIYVCSAQPANYAGIAAVALTATAIPGYAANADGDVSGRKLAVNELVDESITASGTATHIVLASATVLLYVTTCTSQELSSGGTVTIPTWDIEIEDAA